MLKPDFLSWVLIGVFASTPFAGIAQKSASDGAYGGYVGSSRQLQLEMDSASKRSALQRALTRDGEPGGADGVQVEMQVKLDPHQKGGGNFTTIELQPLKQGVSPASTLAIWDRTKNEVHAQFNRKKGLQVGDFLVILGDSMGGKYPVGQVSILPAGKTIEIIAPLLGEKSKVAAGSTPTNINAEGQRPSSAYQTPRAGPGYVPPTPSGAVFVPQVGPGYIPPGQKGQ